MTVLPASCTGLALGTPPRLRRHALRFSVSAAMPCHLGLGRNLRLVSVTSQVWSHSRVCENIGWSTY
jgi:hypothetical protein